MGSSDHRPFTFPQLRVPIQQKKETQGDVLLTEHIFVKHRAAVAHHTTACGHQCITCSLPLVRTRTQQGDSYLDKEEALCLQDTRAAIRRERYSEWRIGGEESLKAACLKLHTRGSGRVFLHLSNQILLF